MNPYMKGIGYAVFIVNILMLSYYNTLQAYALYYLGNSFQSPVPWAHCDISWNTEFCHLRSSLNDSFANETNITRNNLPATEYFTRHLLGAHHSTGFDNLVGIKWDLLLCVILIFILTQIINIIFTRHS